MHTHQPANTWRSFDTRGSTQNQNGQKKTETKTMTWQKNKTVTWLETRRTGQNPWSCDWQLEHARFSAEKSGTTLIRDTDRAWRIFEKELCWSQTTNVKPDWSETAHQGTATRIKVTWLTRLQGSIMQILNCQQMRITVLWKCLADQSELFSLLRDSLKAAEYYRLYICWSVSRKYIVICVNAKVCHITCLSA